MVIGNNVRSIIPNKACTCTSGYFADIACLEITHAINGRNVNHRGAIVLKNANGT